MIRAFSRSKIRNAEPGIGLHDAQQANPRHHIVTQEELCPDEDIPLPPVNPVPHRSSVLRSSHRLAVNPQDAGQGELSLHFFFNPFSAFANRVQSWPAASCAEIGNRIGGSAVMAKHRALLP